MAYSSRVSECSSDVCSSDLPVNLLYPFDVDVAGPREAGSAAEHLLEILEAGLVGAADGRHCIVLRRPFGLELARPLDSAALAASGIAHFERSEEHTSELQSLMRISYAVFCLKKKT